MSDDKKKPAKPPPPKSAPLPPELREDAGRIRDVTGIPEDPKDKPKTPKK